MDLEKFGFTLLHLGINQKDAEEGTNTAKTMAQYFGFPLRETSGSIFANEQFEIMKKPFRGTMGHFAIGTKDIVAAKAWLESQGVVFAPESAKYDAEGHLTLIYSETEVGGFVFHLTQI